jgi:aquaporin Z
LGILCSGRGKVSFVQAGIYMVAQCLGGLFAAGMYYWILGATFTMKPGPGYGIVDALVVEILFTAALVFVVLNVATTDQDADNNYYGLAIGFTVMSAAFACGSISGCSLNPAVTMGVMISNLFHTGGGMSYFALYILGPFTGALLAAGLFRIVRRAEYAKLPQ